MPSEEDRRIDGPGRRREDWDREMRLREAEMGLHDAERLLKDREETILRLAGRVEMLMEDRTRFEHTLFGVTGRNGLNSEVRGMRDQIRDVAEGLRRMRDEEFVEMRESHKETRRAVRNWALGLLPVLVAIVGIFATFVHH